MAPPKTPTLADPVVLPQAPAQSLPAAVVTPKIAAIVRAIRDSGQHYIMAFTAQANDGTRGCKYSSERVSADEFDAIRAALPPVEVLSVEARARSRAWAAAERYD